VIAAGVNVDRKKRFGSLLDSKDHPVVPREVRLTMRRRF
jgi:hypothetical protein